MERRFIYRRFVRTLAAASALAATAACAAGEAESPLVLDDAWARPAIHLGDAAGHADVNSAAYMVLRNRGATADRLIGASSPAARVVELHRSSLEDGIMRMEHVDAIELPPRSEVRLEPGGYHLMLIGIRESLEVGDTVEITLHFEYGGTLTRRIPVAQP